MNERVSSGSRTRTLPSRPPGPPPTGGRPAPVTQGDRVKTMSGSMVNIAKVGHISDSDVSISDICSNIIKRVISRQFDSEPGVQSNSHFPLFGSS